MHLGWWVEKLFFGHLGSVVQATPDSIWKHSPCQERRQQTAHTGVTCTVYTECWEPAGGKHGKLAASSFHVTRFDFLPRLETNLQKGYYMDPLLHFLIKSFSICQLISDLSLLILSYPHFIFAAATVFTSSFIFIKLSLHRTLTPYLS